MSSYLYQYINKDGNVQKAQAIPEDQKPGIKNYSRILLRLMNDDFSPKLDESGKQLITLKHLAEVTVIGFID